MESKRAQGWCLTINNPDPEEDDLSKLSTDATYLIVGKEKGESGTEHLQGYVYFPTKKSLTQLKRYNARAHWEAQRGTFEQAIEYCKKDGEFVEFGIAPLTKKRKGELGKAYWDENLALAKRGRVEECDSKLQITHHNALYAIAARFAPMPSDNEVIDNYWYYGTTGTGKSLKARSENPGFYLKMCNKWWDGYNNEDVAILEDFDKTHKYLGYNLKIWGDRYAFPCEVKGTKANFRPKKIIVTSNYSPQDIWGDDPSTLEPVLRRYKIVHFNGSINDVL